ncbi:MAG: flagellar assembly protein FliH [Campylobacterota bacterium]|nr:flagellar assembly protein FliH [Campylobacterota bacterium]
MKAVITKEKTQAHNIDKYKFKVLAIGGHPEEEEATIATYEEQFTEEQPIVSSSNATANRDELVESLLKKTDDISSNFIKMQMKVEDQETEFKAELERVKEEAYERGVKDGKKTLEAEIESSKKDGLDQFAKSVKTLDASASEFRTSLEGVKQELTLAALEIAKEVIEEELHEHSTAVAKKLSSALISELSSASEITLKVNPKDHGGVSERVSNLEYIKVLSDSAVSEGGVIAISDVGNIDSEIMKRYERIKKAALSG